MATSKTVQDTSVTAPGVVAADPISSVAVTARPGGRARAVGRTILSNKKAVVGTILVGFFILVALIGPLVAPYSATAMGVGLSDQPPGGDHLLGTTRLGQDIFSQLLVGTRGSLIIGFGAGIVATLLAVTVGAIAGYLGGWIDELLTLLTNVFLIIPAIPLIVVMASYAAAFNIRGTTIILFAIILTGWTWGARAVRAQMMSLRNQDFVMAARVAGEGWPRIIFSEILPSMTSIIAANFLFTTVVAVLSEASLEFLGLGDVSAVTWGTMLYWAQNNSALLQGAWYWFIPPGLCIGLFAVGLTLTNYAIDEIANPRLRTQRTATGAGVFSPVANATLPEPERVVDDATVA
jgi:peptide/nickel transport system permease protein